MPMPHAGVGFNLFIHKGRQTRRSDKVKFAPVFLCKLHSLDNTLFGVFFCWSKNQ